MKRILAVILSLMMVFTTLGTVTFAAGGATNVSFTVDKTTAAVGDTITVTVSNGAMTVESFACGFFFDKTKLECKSISGPDSEYQDEFYLTKTNNKTVSATAVSDVSTSNNQGTVGITFTGTANVNYQAGVVLTATFEVKATGDAAFTLYEDTGGTDQFKSDAIETKTVSIAKAPISSVSFTLDKPTQGAALPSLSGLGSGYTGAVEWYEGTSATGAAATGNAKPNTKYTAKVTLTAGSGESFADSVSIPTDYTKVSADATTIVLTKTFDATDSLPAAIVGTAPTAKSLKYNGTEQELVTAGATSDGTMQYSLNNTNWSTAIPKGKDAKTYTVYYKVKGDSGHSDSTVANVKVTIGQKDISGVTIGAIANQSYTGSAITPDPVVTDGTTTLKKGTDYTVSCTNNTNAGTATLTITGTGNYKGTNSKNFTIDPATQTLTVPGSYNVAFNKTLDLNTICSSNAPGAKLKFALAYLASMPSGTSFDATTGKVTAGNNTGSFKVTVDSDAVTPNYKAALQGTITVNIVATPAASVAAAPTAKTDLKYNGNDQALVSKGTANGGTMQYSLDNTNWSTAIPKGKDAKTYTVYYMVKGDSDHIDYTPASNTVSVSIAPKELQSSDLEKSGGSATKVYDGTATSSITVRVRASSLYGTDTLSINGSAVYNSANVSDANKITFTPTAITTGNYRLAATEVLTINNAKITAKDVKLTGGINATDRSYVKDNKTVNLTKGALTFTGLVSGETLDVNIPATGTISDAAAGNGKTVTYSGVTLKDGTGKASNYKLVSPLPTVTVNITKATAPTLAVIPVSQKFTTTTGEKAIGSVMPADAGMLTYTKGAESKTGSVTVTSWDVDSTGKVTYTLSGGVAGDTVTLPVIIGSDNYENSTVNVKITLTAKDDQAALTLTGGTTVVYGQTLQLGTSGGSGTGTVTYAVTNGTGQATIDATGLLTPVKVGTVKVKATKAEDANYNAITSAEVEITITRATPTGAPKYTAITTSGKTLADAGLTTTGSTLNPNAGTLVWVDNAGNVLPDTTAVAANTTYKWLFTPTDANYTTLTGSIELYHKSSSGGGGWYYTYYTIKATAGTNGSISPSGWTSVRDGRDQTFTITPDKGYAVAKVLVDGKSVGAVKSYTFKNVTKDHTIEAIFMKSNGNPQTGVFVMP